VVEKDSKLLGGCESSSPSAQNNIETLSQSSHIDPKLLYDEDMQTQLTNFEANEFALMTRKRQSPKTKVSMNLPESRNSKRKVSDIPEEEEKYEASSSRNSGSSSLTIEDEENECPLLYNSDFENDTEKPIDVSAGDGETTRSTTRRSSKLFWVEISPHQNQVGLFPKPSAIS
jgi:hypothetical protein